MNLKGKLCKKTIGAMCTCILPYLIMFLSFANGCAAMKFPPSPKFGDGLWKSLVTNLGLVEHQMRSTSRDPTDHAKPGGRR